MFTGLLPSEHGAQHDAETLSGEVDTIAELLQRGGYQTFCWAANPHVSRDENMTQGFEVEQHPSDPEALERARAIFDAKMSNSPNAELWRRAARDRDSKWVIKAAGELAQEGVTKWLAQRDPQRPYFAFLNYMEAHRPLIPPRKFREPFMTPEQLEASYKTEIDWKKSWEYCFGLSELDPAELELLKLTYDAAVLELDTMFGDLIRALDAQGLLDNTIVVLTADHGEHLGDHHLLDHQYSVAQALVHVPLVVRFPSRFQAGREARPVMSMDLFPTLLELARIAPPKAGIGYARSLLDPSAKRIRITQYMRPFQRPLEAMRQQHPEQDITTFERGLVSVVDGPWKLVQQLGGTGRLYDVTKDPYEEHDVAAEHPEIAARLHKGLASLLISAQPVSIAGQAERSAEYLKRLRELGY
jgi:arylsulfatase A-like enzyme